MARSGRYGVLLAGVAGLLLFGAAYAMAWLFETARHRTVLAKEGSDAFVVRNAQAIRPARSDYQRYAGADAAWLAANAPPVRWESYSGGAWSWHPSARQVATDSAYLLERTGHTPEAIAVLTRWVTAHPSDVDALLDLARLENSSDRIDDAAAHYRLALDQRPLAATRAELAAMLLAHSRYAEAEREYRRLLAADNANVGYRWALARALAWSDRPREAEAQLRWILARAPGDTAASSMLRSVRAAYQPTVAEARAWVAESPRYRPYRVAYAEALATAKDYAAAAAQYDTLLAGGETVALLREAAGLHSLARDTTGAVRLLGRAVALAPGDDSLRLEYARSLTGIGDSRAAIEQYSTLIARHATPQLLLARGELEVWTGDYARGSADLRASLAQQPSYDAYALLGDVYRWQGDVARAKDMYSRALALRPNDVRVLLALAEVRRLDQLYGAAAGAGETGWTVSSNYAEDNTGFLFLSAGLTRGFALGPSTVISVGADQRRISERYYNRPEQYVYGYEANVGMSRVLPAGFTAKATAGVAEHAMVGAMVIGSVGGSWSHDRVSASVDLGSGPVYQSLMSISAIAPALRTGLTTNAARAMIGRAVTASATVPLSRAQVTVTGERLMLSDGNRRTSFGVAARLPITNNVAALYDGGTLGYAQASDVYWDPSRYTQHMAGVELSARPSDHLLVAVRALPGVASSIEAAALPESTNARFTLPRRTVAQFATSGDLAWRPSRAVQLDASLGYGRGREGSYQAMNGTLRVRLNW